MIDEQAKRIAGIKGRLRKRPPGRWSYNPDELEFEGGGYGKDCFVFLKLAEHQDWSHLAGFVNFVCPAPADIEWLLGVLHRYGGHKNCELNLASTGLCTCGWASIKEVLA